MEGHFNISNKTHSVIASSETAHPRPAEVAVVAVTAVAVVTNAWSAYYVRSNYPCRKITIFLLTLVDAAVCFAGSALHLVAFIAAVYHRGNIYVCVLQNFFRNFQIVSGVLFMLLIATIRFVLTRNKNGSYIMFKMF